MFKKIKKEFLKFTVVSPFVGMEIMESAFKNDKKINKESLIKVVPYFKILQEKKLFLNKLEAEEVFCLAVWLYFEDQLNILLKEKHLPKVFYFQTIKNKTLKVFTYELQKFHEIKTFEFVLFSKEFWIYVNKFLKLLPKNDFHTKLINMLHNKNDLEFHFGPNPNDPI